MDIYKYLNSQAIIEHCRSLNYVFSPVEAAYLIWQSNHHTLEEKIKAWENLISTTPDKKLSVEGMPDECSLHQFLRTYIARARSFIHEFTSAKNGCAFSYKKRYSDAPDRYLDESPLYTSYTACISAAVEESQKRGTILSLLVQKSTLHSAPIEWEEKPSLYLTPGADIMDIGTVPYQGGEDLLVMPFGFYSLWVDIPSPFKVGDLVQGIGYCGQRSDPVVLASIPNEQGNDYFDMCAHAWELDFLGRVYRNTDYGHLSLEYFSGTLTGRKRFLYALSNYFKGVLPMEDLLRSQIITLLDDLSTRMIGIEGWECDRKHLAGLDQSAIPLP